MLIKRSFTLSGHRTSVALEPEFWAVLDGMATRQGLTPSALVAQLDATRTPAEPLASRLRVAALANALTSEKDPARILSIGRRNVRTTGEML